MTDDDLIGAATVCMADDVASAAASELHAVLALLGRLPGLNVTDVLRDEAVARVVAGDPTAPVFVAAWQSHIERVAFHDVIGVW